MDFTEITANLLDLGYEVSSFSDAKKAIAYLDEAIDNKSVGFGGSLTLKDMGLYEVLSKHNDVHWHWNVEDDASPAEILRKNQTCDIYLSSVNALSKKGEIVNIDGTCNRLSASLFGHEKVYFVIGRNKLADDLASAIYRARNVAAPLNAKRLNKQTPCVVDLKCHDCQAKDRICAALTVLYRKPGKARYEIVLIDEDLGY